MSRIWFRTGMLLLALTILAVQASAAPAADEEEAERAVTLKEVPAKVKATIAKAAGKNEVKEIEEVVLKLFEAEWTKGESQVEVLITPGGKVLIKKIEKVGDEKEEAGRKDEEEGKKAAQEEEDGESDEKEIGVGELPAKVKATVEKLAGKKELKIEQLRMKFYEAMWLQDGKEVEILVTFDGKLAKADEEKPKKQGKAVAQKNGKDRKDNDDKD